MADNDTKINPGGTEENKTEPDAKNPAVGGAEAPTPDKVGKVVNITFNKGTEQAEAEKKDAPVAENAEKVETLKNSNGKENPGAVKKEAETDKTDGAAKVDPAAKKDDKGDKPPKDGKDDKGEKPPKDDKTADDKLKKEQEALLKNLDEKAEALKPKEKKTREPRMPGETKTKDAAAVGGGGVGGTGDNKTEPESPPAQDVPAQPREAPRANMKEEIVEIPHSELFAFKDHPFKVQDDTAMKNLIQSVAERGVDQPALVRPREDGGYELVAGHRRQHASELAGYATLSCIVRNMTDDEAILAMAETNFNQRDKILPSERAKALDMQLNAIKRQGARFDGVAKGDMGKRSVEIIAERNGMNYKTVQRYIALNNLVPELMKLVDDGKISPTTSGYQMSYLKPKNQQYIAVSIESEAPVPAEDKVKRMRDLEGKKLLNGDVIDGIMLEEKKKEDRKVVLNSQDLDKFFGQEKTPAEMKETILRALDDYKTRQPLEFGKTEKPKEKEL